MNCCARAVLLIHVLVAIAPHTAFCQPDYRERNDRGAGDLVDLGETLVHDLWGVVKSPFEIRGEQWYPVGGTALTFALLYHYDEEIQRAAQENKDEGLLGVIDEIGSTFEVLGLMGSTGRYYAGGIAVGYLFRWERLERLSTDILFSHLVGGLIRQGFVRVVDRSRPHEGEGAYNYGDGGTSLPSGHSSTVFQLATVLSHHFPRW